MRARVFLTGRRHVVSAALRRARYAATVVRLAQAFEQKRRLRLRESST
jgi:hypothetical protein